MQLCQAPVVVLTISGRVIIYLTFPPRTGMPTDKCIALAFNYFVHSVWWRGLLSMSTWVEKCICCTVAISNIRDIAVLLTLLRDFNITRLMSCRMLDASSMGLSWIWRHKMPEISAEWLLEISLGSINTWTASKHIKNWRQFKVLNVAN